MKLPERPNWTNELLSLREKRAFCDGIIRCSNGETFAVDRCIIAAASSYFKALFLNVLDPNEQNHEVFLPDISSDIMKIIIKFAYTGEICGIDSTNFERFIRAIDRLAVSGALEICHQLLIDSLNIENCIWTLKLSGLYFAPRVIEKSMLFIVHNFATIWRNSNDFYNLTSDEFADILGDDRLNVRREETTYEALMAWISFDFPKRSRSFGKLLRLVRFGNAALTFIETTVMQNVLVQNDPRLRLYIDRVNRVLTDIHIDPVPSKFDVQLHPFLRPRIPKDIIFVYGGWSTASATNVIETYDCRVNKWYTAEGYEGSKPRAYHGMIYLKGLVYIIGGFDGRQHFNDVRAFDPKTKTWFDKGCMNTARCYVSVALLNDYIYAMGGFDGLIRTNTCEKYDHVANQWTFVAPMNHNRSDACATAFDGKIYIAGGFNGSEVLQSSEFYNPEADEWTLIANMVRPRSGVQIVTHGKYIYALGGNNGQMRQTSIERYDPQENVWEIISNMRTSRSNFACVVLENIIYVIGGFNGVTTISAVECYDPSTNLWQDMWNMNLHRSALSACCVPDLPNAKEYTWLRRELRHSFQSKSTSHLSNSLSS
ncbi:kelch-like protein 10 [Dinothrombium tinctorium]|uniref:Kelch-like protein diablo n=1 Tax=Dinothrombium tinctorium TaxID=1965070 RepID=A0A443R7W6_9ACAR|nr:kelch-like protein 10 [Dinothrombium tinctorium]